MLVVPAKPICHRSNENIYALELDQFTNSKSSYIQDSSRRGWFLVPFRCISCGVLLACAWGCVRCTCPRWICTCPCLGWRCTGNRQSARRTVRIIDESECSKSSRKLWRSLWRLCCSSLDCVWFSVEERLNLTCLIWNQRSIRISWSSFPKGYSAGSRNCNACLKYKTIDSLINMTFRHFKLFEISSLMC